MTTCIASKSYQAIETPQTITFTPSDFAGCSATIKPTLDISINITLNTTDSTANAIVTFGSGTNTINYVVKSMKVGTVYSGTITQSNNAFTVTVPNGNTGAYPNILCGPISLPQPFITRNIVVLHANIPGLTGYTAGDTYNINLLACTSNSFTNPMIGATIMFARSTQIQINTDLDDLHIVVNPCIGCKCIINDGCPAAVCGMSACDSSICKNKIAQRVTRVPRIQAVAQTKIDGSDMAEAIFIICDEFSYEVGCDIPDNTCAVRYIRPDQIKETRFDQCCPYMVSVVRGKGVTLLQRLTYIYEKCALTISFDEFYRRIILYGMARYILARLLFCEFNIKFLLGKYSKAFFDELNKSRFCAFVELFKDCSSPIAGYEKYFKYSFTHKLPNKESHKLVNEKVKPNKESNSHNLVSEKVKPNKEYHSHNLVSEKVKPNKEYHSHKLPNKESDSHKLPNKESDSHKFLSEKSNSHKFLSEKSDSHI